MSSLLRSLLLALTVAVIFVLALVTGISLGLGSMGAISVALSAILLAVVLAAVVVPGISRWLRPRRYVREVLEEPPWLLGLYLGLTGLGGFVHGALWGLATTALMVVVAIGAFRLARKAWPESSQLDLSTCNNCGFALYGRASESCPECGYTSFVLGWWDGRWVFVYLPLPGETGYSAAMWGLRPDEVDPSSLSGEPGDWDERGPVLWLRNVPDDLVCYHRLKRDGKAVLPTYHPADGLFGVFPVRAGDDELVVQVDPAELDKQVSDDIVERNRAALRRA